MLAFNPKCRDANHQYRNRISVTSTTALRSTYNPVIWRTNQLFARDCYRVSKLNRSLEIDRKNGLSLSYSVVKGSVDWAQWTAEIGLYSSSLKMSKAKRPCLIFAVQIDRTIIVVQNIHAIKIRLKEISQLW